MVGLGVCTGKCLLSYDGVETATLRLPVAFSIYYTLLRGHEPHETASLGDDHVVTRREKFQDKEFPLPTGPIGDIIIHKCWNGEYRSISELSAELAGSDRQHLAASEDQKWLEMRKLECKSFIERGSVDI